MRQKAICSGVTSLLVMAALLIYSMLPTWFRPITPIFVRILIGGASVSLLTAVVAGVRGSRLWFLATLLPIAFFLMLLNFEQATEIKITSVSGVPTFTLRKWDAHGLRSLQPGIPQRSRTPQ